MKEHIPINQLIDAIKGRLDRTELEGLDEHLSSCKACQATKASLEKAEGIIKGMSARKTGEAYEKLDDVTKKRIQRTVLENLVPDKREQKRIAEKIPEVSFTGGLVRPDQFFREDGFRLAAAPLDVGTAWGVAVDEKGKGCLIKITATVDYEIKEAGTLEIIAKEIESIEEGARHYKFTKPSEYLNKQLTKRFKRIPCLAPLLLHKRAVEIEIEAADGSGKYLDRVESLLLATIIAVVKAAAGLSGNDNSIFSSNVGPTGKLSGVGKLREKARGLLSDRTFDLVASRDDSEKLKKFFDKSFHDRIRGFNELEKVIMALWPENEMENTMEGKEFRSSPLERTLSSSIFRSPSFYLLAIICAGLALLLALVGGPYQMADLMTAWYLRPGPSDIFRNAQALKHILSSVVGLWLIVDAITIIVWMAKKGERFLFVIKIIFSGSGFRQLIPLILLTYITVNLYVFVRDFYVFPEDFQKYERIEYLLDNQYLKRITGPIPDYRYLKFRELKAGSNKKNWIEALDVGLVVRPEAEMFKKTFKGMSDLLLSKVTSKKYARLVLKKYMGYAEAVRNLPDARNRIAGTLKSCRDLIKTYKLENDFVEEYQQTFGGFLERLIRTYKLEGI